MQCGAADGPSCNITVPVSPPMRQENRDRSPGGSTAAVWTLEESTARRSVIADYARTQPDAGQCRHQPRIRRMLVVVTLRRWRRRRNARDGRCGTPPRRRHPARAHAGARAREFERRRCQCSVKRPHGAAVAAVLHSRWPLCRAASAEQSGRGGLPPLERQKSRVWAIKEAEFPIAAWAVSDEE